MRLMVGNCSRVNAVLISAILGKFYVSSRRAALTSDLPLGVLFADEAFYNNVLCNNLRNRGAKAVTPSKADRRGAIPKNAEQYRWRCAVENYFGEIKEFRVVNTRYDKKESSFAAKKKENIVYTDMLGEALLL